MRTYQEQLGNLVESEDPPIPQRTTSLAKPVGPTRTKHILHMALLTTIFLAIPATLLLYYHHWIAGGVFALLSIAMFSQTSTSNVWIAACPYCSAVFEPSQGLRTDNEGKVVQCRTCFEYSIYSSGRVRAHDSNAISEVPEFVSPLFENGVWPNGCVACGAAPTRLEEAKTRNVSYGMLAFGRIWVTSAKASGIPYCEAHRAAVELKMDQAKRVTLLWCSLRMMRRYVAANRKLGRKPAGRKWI